MSIKTTDYIHHALGADEARLRHFDCSFNLYI